MDALILVYRAADIATVMLNRPEKLNALSKALWRCVSEVMQKLGADVTLRWIVLGGAGDKAFSPGADISEFETERASLIRRARMAKSCTKRWPRSAIAAIQLLC